MHKVLILRGKPMKKLLIAFVVMAVSAVAHAQFVFAPSLHYSSIDFEQSQPSSSSGDSSKLMIDGKIGYVLSNGIFLGGMYSHIGGMDIFGGEGSGYNLGASFGYMASMGFYIIGTYHLLGDYTVTQMAVENKYSGAKGPQVNIGWVFPLASSFYLGPEISWRQIEWNKIEASGVSADTDLKFTNIEPSISFWFMF